MMWIALTVQVGPSGLGHAKHVREASEPAAYIAGNVFVATFVVCAVKLNNLNSVLRPLSGF